MPKERKAKVWELGSDLGYGPTLKVQVGNNDGYGYDDITLSMSLGGETNGSASMNLTLNYLTLQGVEKLIEALQAAKMEWCERQEEEY